MKAYEFTTDINQGFVKIPYHYLGELAKSQKVRVIILTEDNSDSSTKELSNKLSEILVLPELEQNENLFERDHELTRDIIL